MSVEILTVSLSDESVEKLAVAVAARLLKGSQAITESYPPSAQNPQGAESPGFPQQADPWANGGQFTQPPNTPPAQQQYPQAAPQQPQQPAQNGPVCLHGPMRFVPAGFSQSTGRSYPAFYGCTAQRGDPSKCKSVPA